MRLAMVYQKGWEFYVDPIVASMPTEIDVVRVTNTKNYRLFDPRFILQALTLAIRIRRSEADLVHIQHFFPFLGYFLLLMRMRLVITLHETEPRNLKGGLYGRLSAWLLWNVAFLAPVFVWKAKRLIVLSESMKRNYKTDVIPMGGTHFSFLPVSDQERMVLFFGSMWWSKGLDILLKSMLASRLTNVKLVVAGAGRIPKEWTELIGLCSERFRIDVRNRYIEEDELRALFAACTVVVLPYRSVSTSSILTTAFGYGKPVVASPIGSFLQHVVNGKTGFLADEGGFADAIGKIMDDSDLRMEMRKNIAEFMASRSWKRIAEMHVQTYLKAW